MGTYAPEFTVFHSIQTETTPLFSAVTSNSYELVEKLIDKGVNIDASRVRNI